jgi:hypothetical protein
VSPGARALLALGLAAIAGCSSKGRGEATPSAASARAAVVSGVTSAPSASVAGTTSASAAGATSAAPTGTHALELGVAGEDEAARTLGAAKVVALAKPRIAAGRLAGPNVLDATVEEATGSASRHPITLSLSLLGAPSAHRRPLAYARLAQALGAHIVPATVERHLGAGALVALLEEKPLLHARLRKLLAVENDGTVTALLAAPSPSAQGDPWAVPVVNALHPSSAVLIKRWEGWAASPAPVPGETAQLTRDLVEMLALDYLAAYGTRTAVLHVPARGALIAEDNRDAFPDHVQRSLVDPLLRRLRAVARFPRGLRDALARLDRPRAEALLHPGRFEDWLVSPRSLIELDERRAGLLSLIEAQIALRGEAAVLSL